MSVVAAVRDEIKKRLGDSYLISGIWIPGGDDGLAFCKATDGLMFATVMLSPDRATIVNSRGDSVTDIIKAQICNSGVRVSMSDPDLFDKIEREIHTMGQK